MLLQNFFMWVYLSLSQKECLIHHHDFWGSFFRKIWVKLCSSTIFMSKDTEWRLIVPAGVWKVVQVAMFMESCKKMNRFYFPLLLKLFENRFKGEMVSALVFLRLRHTLIWGVLVSFLQPYTLTVHNLTIFFGGDEVKSTVHLKLSTELSFKEMKHPEIVRGRWECLPFIWEKWLRRISCF